MPRTDRAKGRGAGARPTIPPMDWQRSGGVFGVPLSIEGQVIGEVVLGAEPLAAALERYRARRAGPSRPTAVTTAAVRRWVSAYSTSLGRQVATDVFWAMDAAARQDEPAVTGATPEDRLADADAGAAVRDLVDAGTAGFALVRWLDDPVSRWLPRAARALLPWRGTGREMNMGEYLGLASMQGNRAALEAVLTVLSVRVQPRKRAADWRTILERFHATRDALRPRLRELARARDRAAGWDRLFADAIGDRLAAAGFSDGLRAGAPIPAPGDLAADLVGSESGVRRTSILQRWKGRRQILPSRIAP